LIRAAFAGSEFGLLFVSTSAATSKQKPIGTAHIAIFLQIMM
jgi:hypothetical protein